MRGRGSRQAGGQVRNNIGGGMGKNPWLSKSHTAVGALHGCADFCRWEASGPRSSPPQGLARTRQRAGQPPVRKDFGSTASFSSSTKHRRPSPRFDFNFDNQSVAAPWRRQAALGEKPARAMATMPLGMIRPSSALPSRHHELLLPYHLAYDVGREAAAKLPLAHPGETNHAWHDSSSPSVYRPRYSFWVVRRRGCSWTHMFASSA